jgi:hypothetical protein
VYFQYLLICINWLFAVAYFAGFFSYRTCRNSDQLISQLTRNQLISQLTRNQLISQLTRNQLIECVVGPYNNLSFPLSSSEEEEQRRSAAGKRSADQSADEKPADRGGGQSDRIVACLTTTYLFAKIRPQLLVKHVQTLQPYLNIKCFVQVGKIIKN